MACLGVRHSIKFPEENHEVNAYGTLNVLAQASVSRVKRFVYCSSSEVYGTALKVPMAESHPTYPMTVYGASKLAGEAYARAYNRTYGMDTVVVRPFNTYGPRSHHEGDAGEFIPKSVVRVLNGKPIVIFGNGRQTRDFTYVTDSAAGIIAAGMCKRTTGGTFNVGSSFEISILALAKKILSMSGEKGGKIKHIKDRPGDVSRLFAETSLFKRTTGWKPVTGFNEGLLSTIEWFKTRPGGVSKLLKQERERNWV
jgi:UDP-glucose 4-epimerase